MVREALVTSVTWTPPFTPPVRFQTTQESVLPKSRSPASAFSRAPSTLSRIHFDLRAGEVGRQRQADAVLVAVDALLARELVEIAAVRVSCQTIAL